jgi:hypothetical protein
MEEVNKDKESIKKQPTLGKIIIEMKVRNILIYLSSCFSKKKKNTNTDNTD